MAKQVIQQCIDNLNESGFFSNNIKSLPFSRFNILTSLLSIIQYEKCFYSKSSFCSSNQNKDKLSEFLSVNVKTVVLKHRNGNDLECWDINPNNAAKYIVFCSGIGSEKTEKSLQDVFEKFVKNGFGLIAFDYSGRGKSGGEFSQKSALEDVMLIYKYLLEKGIGAYNIGLIGHSIGAAIALDFAAKYTVSFLILINPFSKAVDMVKNISLQLWIPDFVKETVKNLPDFLFPLRNRFNNVKTLQKVEVPTLILHNKADDTIPVRLGRRLYFRNKYKKNIKYIELDGSDHDVNTDKIDICLNFIDESHIWFFNK